MTLTYTNKHDVKALDDDCYPKTALSYVDGVTHEQMTALFRKWKQDDQGMTWKEFSATACDPSTFYDGAIVVEWCGMWLAIERDGYTHS